MKERGALAIFVKTPGLSPVKTRLAESLGVEKAREFYELALVATAALAGEISKRNLNIDIYWAVAEKEAHEGEHWEGFPTIWQGEGDLGERLNTVYETLLNKHRFVCFMGADSPHLLVEDITAAIRKVRSGAAFILGETTDGGFYFFGGTKPIPKNSWTSVEYSSAITFQKLSYNLLQISQVSSIPKDFDIDVINDLGRYLKIKTIGLLPEQSALIDWSRITVQSMALGKASHA